VVKRQPLQQGSCAGSMDVESQALPLEVVGDLKPLTFPGVTSSEEIRLSTCSMQWTSVTNCTAESRELGRMNITSCWLGCFLLSKSFSPYESNFYKWPYRCLILELFNDAFSTTKMKMVRIMDWKCERCLINLAPLFMPVFPKSGGTVPMLRKNQETKFIKFLKRHSYYKKNGTWQNHI